MSKPYVALNSGETVQTPNAIIPLYKDPKRLLGTSKLGNAHVARGELQVPIFSAKSSEHQRLSVKQGDVTGRRL